jgi:hypothetical protein
MAAAPGRLATVHPARPDPFQAFAGYPTAVLTVETRLTRDRGSQALLEALLASPLLSFAAPALLSPSELRHILDRTDGRAAGVGELLAELDPRRHTLAWRSLAWLVKYGLLAVAPADREARRRPSPSSRGSASRRR